MAPGSATPYANGPIQKQYLVIHETLEHTKVVGTYSTEEEAFSVALHKQVEVFQAIKEKMLGQVLQVHLDWSLEWKLKMLQEAMEVYFLDVGFESLTNFFTVTNQQVTESVANKRKMPADLRGNTKLAKSNTSCGIASTAKVNSMARYMYQTLPFGMS